MNFLGLLTLCIVAVNAFPPDLHSHPLIPTDGFNGTTWVVLVAGSNTWMNYRHQADIYHAYQIVHNHGIPDTNIIVFHYDDIANDPENPTPGKVINKPGGSDVYHGVPKDYIGADVTPKNFLAAIKGDQALAAQGKKVVQSGPNDHIFIYFADHGAPDLIAFPVEYLYGEDLNNALKEMHENKRYSKLVFYLEACESGSMFDTLLPKDINIYATTASNPTESSWGCYCDDPVITTCLGDLYSVNWLENSDLNTYSTETLLQQFNIVVKETNLSHVQEYGDLTLNTLPLTQFQGNVTKMIIGGDEAPKVPRNPVESGDVPIRVLENRIKYAKDETQRQLFNEELERVLTGRQFLNYHLSQYVDRIKHLVGTEVNSILNTKQVVKQRSCYRKFVDTFNEKCLNLNEHPYVLRKLYTFVNVCENIHLNNAAADVELSVNDAIEHLNQYCHENLNGGYPHKIE